MTRTVRRRAVAPRPFHRTGDDWSARLGDRARRRRVAVASFREPGRAHDHRERDAVVAGAAVARRSQRSPGRSLRAPGQSSVWTSATGGRPRTAGSPRSGCRPTGTGSVARRRRPRSGHGTPVRGSPTPPRGTPPVQRASTVPPSVAITSGVATGSAGGTAAGVSTGAAGSADASRASTSAGVSGCWPGPSRPAPIAPTAVRPTTRAAPRAAAHAATPATRRVRALATAPGCRADRVARLDTALTGR